MAGTSCLHYANWTEHWPGDTELTSVLLEALDSCPGGLGGPKTRTQWDSRGGDAFARVLCKELGTGSIRGAPGVNSPLAGDQKDMMMINIIINTIIIIIITIAVGPKQDLGTLFPPSLLVLPGGAR